MRAITLVRGVFFAFTFGSGMKERLADLKEIDNERKDAELKRRRDLAREEANKDDNFELQVSAVMREQGLTASRDSGS